MADPYAYVPGSPVGQASELLGVLHILLKAVRELLQRLTGVTPTDLLSATRFGPTAAALGAMPPTIPLGDTVAVNASGIRLAAGRSVTGTEGGHVAMSPDAMGGVGVGIDLEYLRAKRKSEETERMRCEHLMQMLGREVKAEMQRQLALMRAEAAGVDEKERRRRKPAGAMTDDLFLPGLRGGVHKPVNDGSLERLRFEAGRERAEAADEIMRVLEEYALVSAVDSVAYLKHTLDDTIPQLARIAAALPPERVMPKTVRPLEMVPPPGSGRTTTSAASRRYTLAPSGHAITNRDTLTRSALSYEKGTRTGSVRELGGAHPSMLLSVSVSNFSAGASSSGASLARGHGDGSVSSSLMPAIRKRSGVMASGSGLRTAARGAAASFTDSLGALGGAGASTQADVLAPFERLGRRKSAVPVSSARRHASDSERQ
ncbi:hypothetical protein EON62_04200 [archaeon]|nr:MAG: hypothetical protein EON62_04200 [archaeon]